MKKLFTGILAFLLSATLFMGQLPGTITFDFRDGTIIANGQSDDGNLTLSGNYSHHSANYGLNMKVEGEINITVEGSSTIRFMGSQYSGLNMVGTADTEGDLGTHDTKVANDLSDVFDFVYSGTGATLNFKLTAGSGNDLYLPFIEVIPAQAGKDASSAEKNIVYYFDLRDESIVPADAPGNTTIEEGIFKIEAGCCNAYGYHGTQHGINYKDGNKITLQVAGNSYIRLGGDQYSGGTVTASSTTGEFDITSQSHQTGSTYADNAPVWVDFLYAGNAGTVELVSSGSTNYLPYIEISPVPFDVSLSAWVQKSGTITINGTDISLTSGASSAEDATITVSDGIVLAAGAETGKVAIDLGGADPESLTPTFSGDISAASIVGNMLEITYSDDTTEPKSFSIELYDNSYLHGITTFDFRDGTIINNGQSADGSLTLSGNYSHHSVDYGLNMKKDAQININVNGSAALHFLGSEYSSLSMEGTLTEAGDLGVLDTKVAQDRVDTYNFVYSEPRDTGASNLQFKAVDPNGGSDVYLPEIKAIPSQMGIAYSQAQKNVPYYFDFREGAVIPKNAPGNVSITKGLIEIRPGSSNAYKWNDTQHGAALNTGNQIDIQVAGNSMIRIGGSIYSGGTITVSSATGNFDFTSQDSQTAGNFGNDGSTIDFIYEGAEGIVTLEFTGTTYVPYIEVSPITYDFSLTPWVQKSGTVTINGVEIGFTSGADNSSPASVTVSEGTVISATSAEASIIIDLGGSDLSSFTPTVTGDIENVGISGDSLILNLSGADSDPKIYIIKVTDSSAEINAEPGKTYTYSFADGSVVPQTSYQSLRYDTFISEDGILTLNSNNTDEALKFGYHDATHGLVMFSGNSADIIVAGNATITWIVCTYGVAEDAVFEFTDENDNVLGTSAAQNIGEEDAYASNFSYTGPAGTITATLKSEGWPTAEIYIHGISIANAAEVVATDKIDVWDFGAGQLDPDIYNNQLTEEAINAWYDGSIEVGSAGNVLPNFSAGVLSWVGGGNDRLRTTNENLTRYDSNMSGVTDYTGRVYVNSAAAVGRYMSFTLSEDDEVTLHMIAQSGGGKIHFEYVPNPSLQNDVVEVTTNGTTTQEVKFVAKYAGNYHVYDSQDKPSYYRIYRQDARYAEISGNVDLSQAEEIPGDYAVLFTNEAGKSWSATVEAGSYNISLPIGYSYELSLAGANAYIISEGNSLDVTDTTSTHDIAIIKVELYAVSGSITGLGDEISNLSLTYSPDPSANRIFMPEPVINTETSTYSVELEPSVEYTISAGGVNDFYIPENTITIGNADQTSDVEFMPRPTFKVTIVADALNAEQLSKLHLTFANLNEEGYVYNFTSVDDIMLRDGVYSIAYDGLDAYPVELARTSNLTVDGADVSKTLEFNKVTNWTFDDKVITSSTVAYKGLLLNGNLKNEIAKGHLAGSAGDVIQVPVNAGDKLRVTYYYTADFTIGESDSYITNSNSTSILEFADYTYNGSEPGYVDITIGSSVSTTYITNIAIGEIVDFSPEITVGENKDYQTINGALDAIRKMVRNDDERVTVLIDPGNYEEMLVVDIPNVSLKNASATPDIALTNKGVDISDNAVRITSYYGHGYNYYSMGSDQKWHDDVLRVNKENGYLSYENKGAGTTNGSYWNATVAVSAKGFESDHIIFENSFNQYISNKESEDVVVEWQSGGKGTRPTDYGNTAVQNRSFVERAAAIAILGSADKVILNKCRVVGRQDSFYGAGPARVVVYKGEMMGAVDYIFGAMVAVFYKSDLEMNVSDASNDASYLTAAQQSGGRGYLMYECNVTAPVSGVETASQYLAKPGYFGRPWQATTSEVVFYQTTIDTTDYPGYEGKSLIDPLGWQNTLGGESEMMYEYETIELSGEDNSASRAPWATLLSTPVLNDGTDITTFNFTKGNDNWDPIPDLIANDVTGVKYPDHPESAVQVYAQGEQIFISNVSSEALVKVYSINGALVKSEKVYGNTSFNFAKGLWIVQIEAADGRKVAKVAVY